MSTLRRHITKNILLTFLFLLGIGQMFALKPNKTVDVATLSQLSAIENISSEETTVEMPSSFVSNWVYAHLFDSPFENEENEENEEEEVEESKSHFVKVSVKDFYYTDLICCNALKLHAEQDTEQDDLILHDCFYAIEHESSLILFQVFRL